MNKTLSLYIAALLLFVAGPVLSRQEEGKTRIPPYKTFTLENGLRVVLMEYPRLPLVEIQMSTHGGTSLDPDSLIGLASITAGLLNQGTTSRSATQIAEEIDFIGGSLSAQAGLDRFTVSSEFLTKDFQKGLELFADVVLNPIFPEEELERERSQRLATIQRYKEDPSTIAGLAFTRLIYRGHPYGNQSIGTAATLGRMTRGNVQDFYRAVFLPNASILVAVGDFNTDAMLQSIRQAFGAWQPGPVPELPMKPLAVHRGRSVFIVNKPDVTQTQIRIGNTGIDARHADWFAVQVANSILGSGFTSRLVEEIRVRRSLSYGAGSSFLSYRQGGMYRVSTFTKNETTRETIDVALEEIRKFRETGATEEELRKAQNYLAGSFARGLQAPENLASNLSFQMFYGLPDDYLETYVQKLRGITLEDVRRAVNAHFRYNDLIILVVTNPKEVRASLESLGRIEQLQVDDLIY